MGRERSDRYTDPSIARRVLKPYKLRAETIALKTTILGHEAVPPEFAAEIHRFRFQLNDGVNPHDEYVSLRTAQVLVASLDGGNAFFRMLQEIVRTDSNDYDRLIGSTFDDRQGDVLSGLPSSSANSS